MAVAAGLVVSLNGYAAEDNVVTEPQYLNSFFGLDPNGKLIELERTRVTFHAKTKALPGYYSVKMTTEFKPGSSPIRLPANVQFVVRGRSELDPASRFELRMLKASKSHREFVMTQGRGSVFGGGSRTNLDEGAIPLSFEEYGSNSYRLTATGPLAPGEYALAVRGMVSELYCFGVDGEK